MFERFEEALKVAHVAMINANALKDLPESERQYWKLEITANGVCLYENGRFVVTGYNDCGKVIRDLLARGKPDVVLVPVKLNVAQYYAEKCDGKTDRGIFMHEACKEALEPFQEMLYPPTPMATCHPDKPNYFEGYCEDCFGG